MISVEYCQLLARYNRWMNERMYALVAEFGEEERTRDRGAFFGSMHRALTGRLTPAWPAGVLEYRSVSDPRLRRLDRWIAVAHLFQHATHHRGQLATLIKQAGRDVGVTDLPWMPGVVKFIE